MLRYFGREYSINEVKERVGHISQVIGVKKYILNNGRSKGVEAVDVRTGGGLNYTVLTDRGMDIAWAEYRGIPISYISGTGIVSPTFYEAEGDEWLRGFYAGLLTTCGLTQVGDPCEYNAASYGLHGRISNIPAENTCADEYWDGENYIIYIKGQLRQVKSCCENIVLNRTIKSLAGKNKIIIEDTVENAGYTKQPFMILYHCNIGFPLLNENTDVIIPNTKISSMFKDKELDIPNYNIIIGPQDEYEERVFYFDTKSDKEGFSYVCITNDKNNPELALRIKYNRDVLNNLAQWKQMSKGEYVLGIEPCNNYVKGIKYEAEIKNLDFLNPQEKRYITLEFEIMDDKSEIVDFTNSIKAL